MEHLIYFIFPIYIETETPQPHIFWWIFKDLLDIHQSDDRLLLFKYTAQPPDRTLASKARSPGDNFKWTQKMKRKCRKQNALMYVEHTYSGP